MQFFSMHLHELPMFTGFAPVWGQCPQSMIVPLDKELKSGNLSAYSYGVIIRLTHKVVYKLTMKHKVVQEKVGGVMGGKVLDLPEVRLYHQGVEEGLKEGEAERKKLQSEVDELRKEIETLKAMVK